MIRHVYTVLLAAMVALLVGTWHGHHAATIRVVDMRRALAEPAARLARSTLSADRQGQFMTRFTKALPHVMEAYAKAHACTLISAPVIAHDNELDITSLMVEQTIQRINHAR